LVPRGLSGLRLDAAPSRALSLTRLRRDALSFFFSFGRGPLEGGGRSSPPPPVDPPQRNSAGLLANVCESLDGGERVHFLPADSTGDAAATSSGLTRMIANGLPSGANAAMVGGDGRVDQVAAKPSKARQRSVLIRTRKPRIADNVGHQDRGQFPGLAHDANSLRRQG
jgi:hypothetical protein